MDEDVKVFNRILDKHSVNFESDNFKGWKVTEIMYCKLQWVIDVTEDLESHVDILLDLQKFIEDLQKLEDE